MHQAFLCDRIEPVVDTVAGKLRGYLTHGTYTFHGMKYADARRFQMPKPVAPWQGVKDALAYGFDCPLLVQPQPSNELIVAHRYWPQNEDCQYLNVWTQSLDPGAKRPVMVWLHGGGWTSGSAIEHVAYDGENLSKHGDVVVVSINHRLNVLGHLNLEPYDDKYANSGNAGLADMVAALQWIHDNIAKFGGDPDNVTLFGQSGGGMKIWALMQTPAADGLFQKGIIQSGVADDFKSPLSDSNMIVGALLDELGLSESAVGMLEIMPYERLAAAYVKVVGKVKAAGEYIGCSPMENDYYLGNPRTMGFCEHARTIPVMVGSALGEMNWHAAPDRKDLTGADTDALLARAFGEDADEIKARFAAAYPTKDSADALGLDFVFRAASKDFIAKKAAYTEAPTYSYLLTYTFPFEGGKPAWHCADIPLVFHNAGLLPLFNQPGAIAMLQEQMCDAWVAFARTGDPNHDGLPEWPACAPDDEATMVFDDPCQVRHNHDDALYELYDEIGPQWGGLDPDPR